MKRVILAVSGGVDSSVAAHLLVEEGWEVVGATFDLWPCATAASAVDDARAVCGQLGVEHVVVPARERFREGVVNPFCRAYFQGRTPNPCVVCNPLVKFRLLEELARERDAQAIATGHYARVEGPDCRNRMSLRKGKAVGKEQSYVLYGLTQEQLRLAYLPLGRLDKARIREMAAALGLHTHAKPDSQEICFIPDNDYGGFLERERPEWMRPGNIVDTDGTVLARHAGVHRFTLGQRRGLGVAVGAPRYVVRIEPDTATVVVGAREETLAESFLVQNVNWVSIPPPSGPIAATVKIRYAHRGAEAEVAPQGDGACVTFKRPQHAVTPGQAAVFYRDDLLLGGGAIEKVIG